MIFLSCYTPANWEITVHGKRVIRQAYWGITKNTPENFPAKKLFKQNNTLARLSKQKDNEKSDHNKQTTNERTPVCLVFYLLEFGNVIALLIQL